MVYVNSPGVPPQYGGRSDMRSAAETDRSWWWERRFAWEIERLLEGGFGIGSPRALESRRKAVRSRIAANIIFLLLLGDLALVSVGFSEPEAWAAAALAALGLTFALFMNKAGFVSSAAIVIIVIIEVATWPTIWLYAPGLVVDAWPAFDLVVLAPIIAAALFRSWPPAVVLVLMNLGVTLATVLLQPWAPDMQLEMTTLGPSIAGYVTVLSRPIAIQALGVGVMIIVRRLAFAEIARADREAQLRLHYQEEADVSSQEAIAFQRAASQFATIYRFRHDSARSKAGAIPRLDTMGYPPRGTEGRWFLQVNGLSEADAVSLTMRHQMNYVLDRLQEGGANAPKMAQLAQALAEVERLSEVVQMSAQISRTPTGFAAGQMDMQARHTRALEVIRRFSSEIPPVGRLHLLIIALAQALMQQELYASSSQAGPGAHGGLGGALDLWAVGQSQPAGGSNGASSSGAAALGDWPTAGEGWPAQGPAQGAAPDPWLWPERE